MKYIIFLLSLLYSYCSTCQTIIDKGIYKVNFSDSLREPRYISYYLYNGGGGSCSRDHYYFKNDLPQIKCATAEDYAHSGYDKGHLANAEDFAFDCVKDELTFRYYNCLPQTPNLNRGLWKQNETLIRKWSKTDTLYIICGGYFGNKKIKNIAVPDYCWKVVQSMRTKQVLFCGWFSNTANATLSEISVSELEAKLNSKIILLN